MVSSNQQKPMLKKNKKNASQHSKKMRNVQEKIQSGPEVIKLFSCSTQLSMKFFPLTDVKMPTIVGILTCMSGKNNILGLTEP